MMLFLKGFIIGIGKIIPGVSGAMLAINFNIYEKALESVTSFFNDWKDNLKFLLLFCSGILLSVIICSNIVVYFFNNNFFITMMFFIGLILGGIYNFSLQIKYSYKNILLIIMIVILFLLLGISNFNNYYVMKNNLFDNLMFFIGGIIEIFASVVPGISGTAILMLIGIYDNILVLISSVMNIDYVVTNLTLYLSYSFGMIVSFIVSSYMMIYLINKYKNYTYTVILGLSISSVLLLLTMTFSCSFSLLELIGGVMLLTVGLLVSCILNN